MSGFPYASRREVRKLGLLHSKSSEAERERLEPPERNERVCGENPDADAHPNGRSDEGRPILNAEEILFSPGSTRPRRQCNSPAR